MSRGEGRKNTFWPPADRKKAAALAWGFVLLLLLGNGEVTLASQGEILFETGADDDVSDISDYEGDVTEDELDRALEEYIRQMDMNSLIQEGGIAKKVEDPVLKTEWVQGKFKYILPNGNAFFSSVPRGTITSGGVDLELPEGTIGLVNFDDEGEKFADSWHFTKPGNYCVRLLMYQQPGSMAADYNLYEIRFYFTILERQDNTLGVFPAPEGFAIKEVKRDGKLLDLQGKRCFFLEDDGYYEIRCEWEEEEGVFIDTGFTRDTTAPFLSFSQEWGPEGALSPIEFYPSEQNCQITMNYNGNHGYAVGNVLTAAGNYELSVEDMAGNRRVYNLRIRQTYHLADKRILVAGAVILAIGAIRLIALRRDMKIL